MARNISKVYLLNTPLENDYKNTIYFNSKSGQQSYFQSKIVKSYTDFSYQRKDKIIRVPEHFDDLIGCNYVMYQNTAYSNKWFYAFITDMVYIDDGRTDVYIETDVMQTWYFDYTVKASFVEREHVDDDTKGLHTVPEQLETGEYIINAKNKNASLGTYSFILACTVDINSDTLDNVSGANYNGIYSGLKYYSLIASQLNTVLKTLADAGKSDSVVSIFVAPSLFIGGTTAGKKGYPVVDASNDVVKKAWINTFGVDETNNYKPTHLNGYVPRNNKLFTYPYCYMLMTNNSGASAVYHYEYFNHPSNSNLCDFYIYAALTPGMSVTLSPQYYKGVDINSNERLNLGKFPICNWNTDVYTNWLTQNAVNIPVNIGSSLLTAVGGIGLMFTGAGAMAGVGTALSGVMGVTSSIGEIYKHSLQPPQAEGNINSGDVAFASGILTYTCYQMTIKKEFAEIIDGYFDMFGYKVNKVKVPNTHHRASYWYTKTIDVNITGAVPNTDMEKIKKCYNSGITFWRNGNEIKDYSVDNYITNIV